MNIDHRPVIAQFGYDQDVIWMPWYRQIEKAFLAEGLPAKSLPVSVFQERIGRVLAKMRLLRALPLTCKKTYIVPIMDVAEFRFFPVCFRNEIVPICFDCWPYRWPRWQKMLNRHRIRDVFFTSQIARDEFASRNEHIRFHWLPEATDTSNWCPKKPLVQRSIDVLELGRKYDAYHSQIVRPLLETKHKHLYQPDSTTTIFAANELAAGYGDSKISICFPKSVTHPELAGPVETVTQRYFESMASRCLIVGSCPSELRELFGYDPVVGVRRDNPMGQLLQILESIGDYQELVDRNFEAVCKSGSWTNRAKSVLETLSKYRTA